MRVAFIGLGTMGRPMASHLVAAGHELVACDADPSSASALGTRIAPTPAGAVADADVAILSLPSPAIVEDGCARSGWARSTVLGPGRSSSTCRPARPALARRLAAVLGEKGIEVLDAPVSGGPTGAEAATLAIMVGGQPETVERCRSLLEAMGSRVEHVGGHGAGQTVKLCNNLIVACTMAGMAEACRVLTEEGVDPVQAYEVFTRSTSDSSVMRRRFPLPGVRPEHPASRDYEAMFRLDLLVKDIRLALELAEQDGVEAPVGRAALRAYESALDAGLGGLDYSAVVKAVRRSDS